MCASERVIVNVHNLGPVIDLSDQELLFEKFKRTKAAKESGGRGWGLGLTVVKGLVEAHAGFVKVQTYHQEGTTFTVNIPLSFKNP